MTGSDPRGDRFGALADAARRLAGEGVGAFPGVLAGLAGALSVTATVVVRRVDRDAPGAILASSAGPAGIPRMRSADSAAVHTAPLVAGEHTVGHLVVLAERELTPVDVTTVDAYADLLGLGLAAGTPGRDAAQHLVDEEAGRAEVAAVLQEGALASLVAARYALDRGTEEDLLRAVLDQALQEIRTAVGMLRPRGLDTDLGRSLRALADDLGRAGCRVDIRLRGMQAGMLSPAATVLAYRVVAAALAGVAGPATVVVDGGAATGRLTLTVTGARNPHDAGALDRWSSRARVLDGALRRHADGVVLHLPVTTPISSSSGALR